MAINVSAAHLMLATGTLVIESIGPTHDSKTDSVLVSRLHMPRARCKPTTGHAARRRGIRPQRSMLSTVRACHVGVRYNLSKGRTRSKASGYGHERSDFAHASERGRSAPRGWADIDSGLGPDHTRRHFAVRHHSLLRWLDVSLRILLHIWAFP